MFHMNKPANIIKHYNTVHMRHVPRSKTRSAKLNPEKYSTCSNMKRQQMQLKQKQKPNPIPRSNANPLANDMQVRGLSLTSSQDEQHPPSNP